MKKIAILAPEIHKPFIEGIQKNAWFIIKEAIENNYEASVFTQKSYGDKIVDSRANIFYWINSCKIKFLKYFIWIFNGLRIVKKIKSNKIDCVLIFSLDWSFFWTIIWLRVLCPQKDVRLIIFSGRELFGAGKLILRLNKKIFNNFFVRSEYLKERLISLLIREDLITKIIFFPNKKSFITKDRVVGSIKKVAYLSNTEESAGINTIIRVASKTPNIRFILALRSFSKREEGRVAEFIKKLKSLNINNIEIRRNISDMPSFYQEVDSVILPVIDVNNTMAAPLVFLESIASGCVVFMNKIRVFSEYDGATIFFSDDNDLIKLLNDFNNGTSPNLSKKEEILLSFVDEKDALKIYLK